MSDTNRRSDAIPAVEPPELERSVVTRMALRASPEQAWTGILYYEQIDRPPPLLLRLLLPAPVRTEGRKSAVGDEALCVYAGGHLRKRVTAIDRGRFYGFAVVEQALAIGGVRLLGGGYRIEALGDGRAEVALETRYVGVKRPRWWWAPFESFVCHRFHRHILTAMRRAIEGSAAAAVQRTPGW